MDLTYFVLLSTNCSLFFTALYCLFCCCSVLSLLKLLNRIEKNVFATLTCCKLCKINNKGISPSATSLTGFVKCLFVSILKLLRCLSIIVTYYIHTPSTFQHFATVRPQTSVRLSVFFCVSVSRSQGQKSEAESYSSSPLWLFLQVSIHRRNRQTSSLT